MAENLRFLSAFLRSPLSIGAIAPSSRWLAARMVEGMDLETAETVVELGPGTGAFTGAILEHLGPESRYMAVELNEEFARRLRAARPDLHVVHDSAERLAEHLAAAGRAHADSIICGLPWASFPKQLQERIMSSTMQSLRSGGRFATFAYVHAAWLPTARRFRRFLEAHFTEVRTTPVVWRNLPPAFVYRCTK